MFFVLIANIFYENNEFAVKVCVIYPAVNRPGMYRSFGKSELAHHIRDFLDDITSFKIEYPL